MNLSCCHILVFLVSLIIISDQVYAQDDSTPHSLRDSTILLRSKKGIFKKLGDAIWIDAPLFEMQNNSGVIKNESPFTKYKGKIINQIQVNSVSYEISFNDTMPSGKKNYKSPRRSAL